MPTIADIKREYPNLADRTDDQIVDVMHRSFYADLPRAKIADALGVKAAPAPAEPSGFLRRAADYGLSAVQSAVQVPQAVVGMADLLSGGRVGKALENKDGAVGFRPDEAISYLDTLKSPEQQAANKAVADASQGAPGDDQGLLAKVGRVGVAALEHPSVIAHSVVQSLPSMMAGGVVGRGALWAGLSAADRAAVLALPKVEQAAAVVAASRVGGGVAGGIGEGVTTMGQQAEQIRTDEANPDRLLHLKQIALAGGTGAVTGLIGMGSGTLAQKLGIENAENLLVGAHADPVKKMGLVRRVIGGAVTEGLLEELPQSVQEQVGQNIATNQPWDKDVDQQAVLGVLSGGAMGMGAQAFHGGHEHAAPVGEPAPTPPGSATPPAPNTGVDFDPAGADAALAAARAPQQPGAAPAAPTDGMPFEADPRFANAPTFVNGAAPASQTFGTPQAANIAIGEQGLMGSHQVVPGPNGGFVIEPVGAPGVSTIAPGIYETPGSPAPKSLGDAIRERLVPVTGPMTAASNAGVEAQAQAADAGVVPPAMAPQAEHEEGDGGPAALSRGTPAEPEKVTLPKDQAAIDQWVQQTPRDQIVQTLAAVPAGERKQMLTQLATTQPDVARELAERMRAAEEAIAPPKPVKEGAPAPTETNPATLRSSAAPQAALPTAFEQREADRPAPPTGEPQPTDILNVQGKPFTTMPGAMKALKAAGDGHDIVRVAKGLVVRPRAAAEANPAAGIVGEQIDGEWHAFSPESGTLGVARADMPQIQAIHRGAMTQFLGARGITHEQTEVPAGSLKPTQAEFSAAKALKAKEFTDTDRSILISSDNHVLDGHHQWLAKLDAGADTLVKVIRLNAPIQQLLADVKEFPSAGVADGAIAAQPTTTEPAPHGQEQAPAAVPETSVEGAPQEATHPGGAGPTEAPAPAATGNGQAGDANAPSGLVAPVPRETAVQRIKRLKAERATPAAAEPAKEATAAAPAQRKSMAVGVEKARKAAEAARADYFAPGNIVSGYGGHDRVVAYHPGTDTESWSVTVHRVVQEDGKWVDAPNDRDRVHRTEPSAKELKAGPTENAPMAETSRSAAEPALATSTAAANETTADEEGAFSRSAGSAPALEGRAAEVEALASAIAKRWVNAPKIVVVKSLDDPAVPKALRDQGQQQRSTGAEGNPEGIYHDGKVYLIADQLHGDMDVLRVLMHESLGHYGLRGVFGQELGTILDRMAILNAGKVRAKARQYGLDYDKQSDRRAAAEEVLAEMAQTNPELGWVQKAIAAVRTWLRQHVPGFRAMKMSDAEIIRNYLLPARRFVKEGEAAARAELAPVLDPSFNPARRRVLAGALAAVSSTKLADGDLDPGMFSRTLGGAIDQALNSTRDVNLPAGYKVGDLLDSTGKLSWWHKTVGTQYNLAQRSPEFKRVYDAVQSFINDTSHYANEAANLAPKMLPKLEHWKDIRKSPISAADTKAIAAPIFEGTLEWTRDAQGKPVRMDDKQAAADAMDSEQKARALFKAGKLSESVLKMWQGLPVDQFDAIIEGKYEREMLKAGVAWTDDELKSMFKATPEQIALYHEFRSATDRSLSNLATSEMLNYAGKDADAVRAQALDLGDHDKAAVLLRDHLFELAEADPARADTLNAAGNKMIEVADHATDMQARGYAPLSRFGTFTLEATLATGERYFSLFETARERAKMQRMLAADGATGIRAGTMSQEDYKLLQGVSPETIALFGQMLGLEGQGSTAKDLAFQTYIKRGTANRSAMKRLLKRQGIAGFSEDAGRVLAGFVYSNGRRTSSNLHMNEMTQAANDVSKESGELKDAAVRLTEYVKNPQEEAQGLRGLLFAQYLGGSVASAMVNATQPFTVTFPYLSQFGGVGKAAKQMAAAVKVAGKDTTGDAALDKALKKAEEDGIVSPQEIHQLQAQAQGKSALKSGDGTTLGDAGAKASNALAKLTLAWGKVFGVAEQFNRRVTFIAAYRTAIDQGIQDPAAFAEKAVNETQFVYTKGSKPAWARGAIGGTLFTFKQFSVNYLELLSRMASAGAPGSPERAAGRKAALLAVAVLFLIGGSDGLPFESNIEDLIDGFMQHMGYNFSSKRKKQEFFANLLGEDGGRFLNKGLSGLPGVPIDVSGRMGMGKLIPGTGLLTKKADYSSDVAELLGPAGDLAKRAGTATGQVLDGHPVDALTTMQSVAARNAQKAVDMLKTDSYRDSKGRKVIDTTVPEAILKGIGFQPNSVARVQEATGEVQQAIALARVRQGEIMAAFAQAMFEKDQDKMADARAMLKRWNTNNPESPIRINMASVMQRVKTMREDKATRIAKTAPKAMRAEVKRELEGVR